VDSQREQTRIERVAARIAVVATLSMLVDTTASAASRIDASVVRGGAASNGGWLIPGLVFGAVALASFSAAEQTNRRRPQ
jgi:hypothetical protein